MSDNATLQLPKDLIQAVISTEIQKSIAAALSNQKVFVDAVAKVLSNKVDSDGRESSSYHTVPFIEYAVTKAIKAAVIETLNSEILAIRN